MAFLKNISTLSPYFLFLIAAMAAVHGANPEVASPLMVVIALAFGTLLFDQERFRKNALIGLAIGSTVLIGFVMPSVYHYWIWWVALWLPVLLVGVLRQLQMKTGVMIAAVVFISAHATVALLIDSPFATLDIKTDMAVSFGTLWSLIPYLVCFLPQFSTPKVYRYLAFQQFVLRVAFTFWGMQSTDAVGSDWYSRYGWPITAVIIALFLAANIFMKRTRWKLISLSAVSLFVIYFSTTQAPEILKIVALLTSFLGVLQVTYSETASYRSRALNILEDVGLGGPVSVLILVTLLLSSKHVDHIQLLIWTFLTLFLSSQIWSARVDEETTEKPTSSHIWILARSILMILMYAGAFWSFR
jgi:hypothetical protein